jgi:hypothetical protein
MVDLGRRVERCIKNANVVLARYSQTAVAYRLLDGGNWHARIGY